MAHLQAIHEHVLSLLGIEDDEPDDENPDELDSDYIDEETAKSLLAELKSLTAA
jgi:hypothetical protein